jgi:hypothetical protein
MDQLRLIFGQGYRPFSLGVDNPADYYQHCQRNPNHRAALLLFTANGPVSRHVFCGRLECNVMVSLMSNDLKYQAKSIFPVVPFQN